MNKSIIALSLTVLLSACGGGSSDGTTMTPAPDPIIAPTPLEPAQPEPEQEYIVEPVDVDLEYSLNPIDFKLEPEQPCHEFTEVETGSDGIVDITEFTVNTCNGLILLGHSVYSGLLAYLKYDLLDQEVEIRYQLDSRKEYLMVPNTVDGRDYFQTASCPHAKHQWRMEVDFEVIKETICHHTVIDVEYLQSGEEFEIIRTIIDPITAQMLVDYTLTGGFNEQLAKLYAK